MKLRLPAHARAAPELERAPEAWRLHEYASLACRLVCGPRPTREGEREHTCVHLREAMPATIDVEALYSVQNRCWH